MLLARSFKPQRFCATCGCYCIRRSAAMLASERGVVSSGAGVSCRRVALLYCMRSIAREYVWARLVVRPKAEERLRSVPLAGVCEGPQELPRPRGRRWPVGVLPLLHDLATGSGPRRHGLQDLPLRPLGIVIVIVLCVVAVLLLLQPRRSGRHLENNRAWHLRAAKARQ